MTSEILYRVPYADTDKMGVVYYANYLIFFERMRNELLRNAGFPYFEIEKRGFMLPVIEAVCYYKSPAFYDDLLTISGYFGLVKGARIQINCEVRRGQTLLVNGYTVHACINSSGKPIRIPKEIVLLSS